MTDDCARLWQAVLGAALHDAATGKAEGYIDSRDFEIVCTFAGFDPDAVAARFEPETYRDAMKAMQLRAA